MTKYSFALIFWLLFSTGAIAGACTNVEMTKAELLKLKQDKFEITDDIERNNLARQFVACLASTDPEIRDGVGYEAYFTWLRGSLLTTETQLFLFEQLVTDIQHAKADKHGVYLPFAVLALSEVVRVDRVKPYLTDKQRHKVVSVVSEYLANTQDYRGFDDRNGWRHSVAHSADVLLQLALNKQITKPQLDIMLNAIAAQVVPANSHFYIYGEAKRLALPMLYILIRDEHSLAQWHNWLAKITNPAPLNTWDSAYKSQLGLAKLHNTRQFLLEVFGLIATSDNKVLQRIKPDIEKALADIR